MSYTNILIVKLSAIGDVIHALPVAPALKKCFPQARITWVVEKPAYDLLTNNPNIDEIIIFDKAKFKTLTGLLCNVPGFISELRKRRFDLALDLQGLFKSAAIAYLSGAPKRLVYCNAREYSNKVSKQVYGPNREGHVVDRYLDVVRALGCDTGSLQYCINITSAEEEMAAAKLKLAGMDIASKYVVLIPGTNWPNKCWPLPHFAQLANKLYEANLIPVITGSPNEQHLVQKILEQTNIPPVDISAKTSLKELAYILQNASAVVAGDTGPMHLAVAMETPVVALFGPTDPKRNGPHGKGHIILRPGHSCQNCWKRQCPDGKDCLADIQVGQVFDAVMRLVNHP
ncbi:lipopolysaccharide heptosyltransferase II [Sporomusa sp. KB1]|uniref:lipopolysaccharide heptosyltransferase II n=1 Tax=Sporomusa sp. KB1 TaxID=943346 RepID=UPI0011A20669|nr:lipopolysaccharide heptosyltransferase II [Sporomusa sp. KB1]